MLQFMKTKSGHSFPENVLRYSALRYLQKKVTARCGQLPERFDTLNAWKKYRGSLVSHLRHALPIWDLDHQQPSQVTAETRLGKNLLLEAVDVYFDGGFFIPVHVYRSTKGPAAGRPAAIVCPGYAQNKNAADVVNMCMGLAEAGLVALATEYDATGERADRPDAETGINNVTAVGQLIGITNVGLRVMSNLAALRYLKTRSDVDARRIGITGLCQGSIATWFTMAVCEEFAAAAPLCGATTYEAIALEYCNRQGGWTGVSPYVFDLLKFADVQHVVAAAAPRPLLVQNNLIDIHWPLAGFQKVKTFAEHIYQLYRARPRCRFHLEHGPHAFAEPFISNLTSWFKQVL